MVFGIFIYMAVVPATSLNTSYERHFLSSSSFFLFFLSSIVYLFLLLSLSLSLSHFKCTSSLLPQIVSFAGYLFVLFIACMLLSVCFPPFHFDESEKNDKCENGKQESG